MQIRCWIAAGVLGLVLPLMAAAQEEVKVRGRIVDADGKTVSGVEIGTFWHTDDRSAMSPYSGTLSGPKGRFTLPVEFYGQSAGLLALDRDQKTGGLVVLEPKDAGKPVEIKLGPLVHFHGMFYCKELDKRPARTIVYMMSGHTRLLECSSGKASFEFDLPAGAYKFWGYGTDIQDVHKDLRLKADKPDVDLQTIVAPATIIAWHKGKLPPAWHVTDARGVKKDVQLADFKGKWVLLEFWGHW